MRTTGLWQGRIISFAYRYQKEAKPFKEMMKVFASEIIPKDQMKVMDIGCGSGRIIHLIVEELRLNPCSIVGVDISHHSLIYASKNIKKFHSPCPVTFHHVDISSPDCFSRWQKNSFDLVTAGLSIQYAEHWDEEEMQWTTDGYKRVLQDVYNILKPEGQFVFSVNTPNPDFSVIAKESKKEILTPLWKFPLRLVVALIMVRQGKMLTTEATNGRFSYLPVGKVKDFLAQKGFKNIRSTLTYADLAWVISCLK